MDGWYLTFTYCFQKHLPHHVYLVVKEPFRTKDLTEAYETFVIELAKKFVQVSP